MEREWGRRERGRESESDKWREWVGGKEGRAGDAGERKRRREREEGDREREGGGGRDKERKRWRDGEIEAERGWRKNSKTLFHKDCSLGSVRNLTTSPC